MHVGLVMECDYRYGETEEAAFDEAFAMAEAAEVGGLNGVWLAERHFAAPRSALDTGGFGIPSVVSAPLILSTAIVARFQHLRVGVAVNVLPLAHPIRMAEEVATLDHISQGRVEFGVGRSGFHRAYDGYGISYAESRERFQESLDIILAAWTNERFSYEGKYYQFNDVCVVPKPYQKPHPPLRIAATTQETFPRVGRAGLPVFVGLRGLDRPALAESLGEYRTAWKKAGHKADTSVYLRIPVYVGETDEQAFADAEDSTMQAFRRLADNFLISANVDGPTPDEERIQRAQLLSAVTYEDLLRDRLAYGNPDTVTKLLREIIDELKLDGVVAEVNVGGGISKDKVLESVKRFATRVAPALR